MQLLVFETSGHRLALPTAVVQEVVRAVAIAPLPRAPQIIEGVINLRGTLAPVVDIRARFRLPATPLAPDQHLILATAGPRLVAVRVDRVVGLIQVDPAAIAPVERVAPGSTHVAGIARLPDGLVIIQDLEQFLFLDEAAGLEDALAEMPG